MMREAKSKEATANKKQWVRRASEQTNKPLWCTPTDRENAMEKESEGKTKNRQTGSEGDDSVSGGERVRIVH
jgi:hypothetical protein